MSSQRNEQPKVEVGSLENENGPPTLDRKHVGVHNSTA